MTIMTTLLEIWQKFWKFNIHFLSNLTDVDWLLLRLIIHCMRNNSSKSTENNKAMRMDLLTELIP